jgi:ubiquinone/menaquinone biosynthesis C-methylase UbiE
MPDHYNIYKQEAETYHELISKQLSLETPIRNIVPKLHCDIIDLGAGSGRLTTLLAPYAKSIIALDQSEHMLGLTARRLEALQLSNWQTRVANHLELPLPNQSADLIVAGWTLCYLTNTDVPNWKRNLMLIMEEMKRILRPGGTIIIFETLGTGTDKPTGPSFLSPYYEALREQYHFSHQWIRTDYSFDNVQQAETLTRFFFGDELANQVVEQELSHLHEYAGIWWKNL